MGTWQAPYKIHLPRRPTEEDLDGLRNMLPLGETWHENLEVRGDLESDGIQIWKDDDGSIELAVRFDMYHWRPELYAGLVEWVDSRHGHLEEAEFRVRIAPGVEAFEESLRNSRAAVFVRDPRKFLASVPTRPDVQPGP